MSSANPIRTVIVQPVQLLREGVEALISGDKYQIIASVSSLDEIELSPDLRGQEMVVLIGPQSTRAQLSAASEARTAYPSAKIVLIVEEMPAAAVQHLVDSTVDGLISQLAPQSVLIGALDLVTLNDARVMVLDRSSREDRNPKPEGESHSGNSGFKQKRTDALSSVVLDSEFPLAQLAPSKNTDNSQLPAELTVKKLSMREWQILDGLVNGYSNKLIARNYNITEATVKVHMKSILRKIRVENRTQAAIWAIEMRCLGDPSEN
jgi:two-component system nitrate/nitrite response regulator NarL